MAGVLVNSESFIADAAIAMFAEKGHQVRREEFRPFVGTGEDRFIGGVAQRPGLPLGPARDKARTPEIYLLLNPRKLPPPPRARQVVHARPAQAPAVAV